MTMTSKRLWVYSGDRPSNGAKELAAQEGFLRLRNSKGYKVKPEDFIINWGTTKLNIGEIVVEKVLNKPEKVYIAANKLISLNWLMGDVNTVEWTKDQVQAQAWCTDGLTIVVRNKLTGHSGDGIVIIEKGGQVPEAPLYTRYVYKVKEFRVHVVNGSVIDTQQKIKDPDREVKTWKVRSHENGFIFARNGINLDPIRDDLAIAATSSLGLDFGAVDIIQDKKGNYLVLECNTAPGLEGQTVESYAKAFRQYL